VNDIDSDSLAEDEAWCAHQRGVAVEYLAQQPATFGEVGEWPAWHLAPYVSVWAVESVIAPGSVGWWVICGDLPTDYASGLDTPSPRAAVATFASRWAKLAASMVRGDPQADCSIGTLADAVELAPLLKARSQVLEKWAEDDSVWSG